MRMARQDMIIGGIFAIMLGGYFLGVWRTQSRWMERARTELAAKRRQVNADTLTASRVDPLRRDIEALKQRYNNDWDRRLPKSQDLAKFLREISGNLAQDNLSSQFFQPGSPNRGPLYNRLPINMKFAGDFLGLGRFLRHIDGMTRLTRVERLTIEPRQDEAGLNVELGMNIYFTEY